MAKEAILRDKYDIAWKLTGIASRRIGWIADANGLDPVALLNHQFPQTPAWKVSQNVHQWLGTADPTVFFEASSLDRRTGQPAIDYIKAAPDSSAARSEEHTSELQ